jgi:hypothetical protein
LEWRYLEPDASALVIAGQKMTLTLPGEPPQTYDLAQRPALAALSTQFRLWLGGDATRLSADYQVRLQTGRDGPTLELLPRQAGPATRFARIVIKFDPQSLLPRAVTLAESNGDTTTVRFQKLRAR